MVSLIPLPKLAVSAKLLLCLLMVVSCESLPLVARSVRLYNQCTFSWLKVNMTGAVAADNSEDGFEYLKIQSTDFSGRFRIYGEKSGRFICFTPRWKLIGSRRYRGPRCAFTEEISDAGYYRFRSVKDPEKYLGFASSGRQLRGRTPSNQACLNWVKIDSDFSIDEHNKLVAGPPRVSMEAINREMDHSGRARRRHRHHRRRQQHRHN